MQRFNIQLPTHSTPENPRLLFVTGRQELWSSDSTATGTNLVKELEPPGGSSWRRRFLRVGSRHVYFTADDGVHGWELWRTDGTATGTVLFDLLPGPNGSTAEPLGLAGGKFYFSAGHMIPGNEPWVIDAGAVSQAIRHGCGGGARVPTIVAPDSVLGSLMTVSGSNAYVGSDALVLLRKPRAALALGGVSCEVHVDQANALVLGGFRLRSGSWSLPIGIPNVAGFLGLRAHVQFVSAPTDGALGLDLTPGLDLTVGR